MKYAKKIHFFLYLLLCFCTLKAQHGKSFIQNYSSKQYVASAQNWFAIQSYGGVMYFANSGGVLEYDGKNWNLVETENNSSINSLGVNKDKNIFVGATGDFGYLAPDGVSTKLKYVSLKNKLPSEEQIFGDIWKVYCSGKKTYFQTFEKVFVLTGDKVEILYPKNVFHLSFLVNDAFYILDRGSGLKYIKNGKLALVPNGSFFAENRIYSMLAYDANRLLIATRENGLFLYEKSTGAIEAFRNAANDFLMENNVYTGISLGNNQFAFGTINGGAIVMDKSGNIISVFNKETGLQDNNVWGLFQDNHKNLWLMLNSGISKVDGKSHITYFNETNGLEGINYSLCKFNNRFYAATSQGLYVKKRLRSNQFEKLEELKSECWNLKRIDENELWIATSMGIYILDKQERLKKLSDDNSFVIYQSKTDINLTYVGTYNGLISFRRKQGEWVKEYVFEEINLPVRSIGVDKDSSVWLGLPLTGIAQIDADLKIKPYATIYDTTDGLLDIMNDRVFEINAKVVIGTQNGLFHLNTVTKRMESYKEFGNYFTTRSQQISHFQPDQTKHWFFSSGLGKHETGFLSNNKITTAPFNKIAKEIIYQIYPDSNCVWFAGEENIYRYQRTEDIESTLNEPYNCLIRQVDIGSKDSTLFWGTHWKASENGLDSLEGSLTQNPNFNPVLNYTYNSVSFQFASTYYDTEQETKYSWYLEGNDDDWSDWKVETKHHYNNLKEGKYVFHVKAQNIYGMESSVATFRFSILPPWYRTVWAYIVYIICFGGIFYGGIKLNTRRLEKEKIALEVIITERTAEIQHQKEEIEHQKEIVDEKNAEIVDSINYAKGIQQSILPSDEKIKHYLPESFVLFRPKDIVSGDFYWMEHKDTIIWFTASDCTGHGVPGAFVSMVGANGLNRAVNEYGLIKPAHILDKLSQLVEDTFAQRKDGMDIALCSIQTLNEKKIVHYAGANNPLWIIRRGEKKLTVNGQEEEPNTSENNVSLYEIKANKQPVGKFEDRMPFTNNEINVSKGDKIYVFSDGYPDQFGGPKGKKFMSKALKKLLIDLFDTSMNQQKEILNATIENWICEANSEQIDDICMFGVQV